MNSSVSRDDQKTVLVTGAAGFIGFHLIRHLLSFYPNWKIIGLDNLNNFYSPDLKLARLKALREPRDFSQRFYFLESDLNDDRLAEALAPFNLDYVVHLAAQAGVRYSMTDPLAFIDSNLRGLTHLLEALCRGKTRPHFLFASSSSVYGESSELASSTEESADFPLSLYAATKRSGEMILYSYSNLYHLPVTALRLFSVYGSWGRPDMAYFLFADKIRKGEPITLYGGKSTEVRRDFTHVSDVVECVRRLLPLTPGTAASQEARYQVFNVGGGNPVPIIELISRLEALMKRPARLVTLPRQKGEVAVNRAEASRLESAIHFKPSIPFEVGIREFIDWYQSYYSI